MFHDRYKEMLAPYALSTLDREDVRTLDEHLATCGDCPLELEEWNAIAAALAFSAVPAEPSSQVRARIIESVQAESSRSTTTRDRSNRRKAMSTVIPFSQTRRFWNATQKFGAIAAILAFVALIISASVLWKQNRALQTEIASVSAQKDEVRRELERQREVVELLSKPAVGVVLLSGTREAPNAHATLTYDRQTGAAFLLTNGLPPAPAGKGYQLWFIVGSKPMPGKVFAIDRAGKAILSDQVPSEALKAAVFAITLEPESGVKAPTGPIYLRSTS